MSKPGTPDTIYLFDMGPEGIVWCDDPAPGEGMDPAAAVEYRRVDTQAQREAEKDRRIMALENALWKTSTEQHCRCMHISRDTARDYENGCCVHDLARAILAAGKVAPAPTNEKASPCRKQVNGHQMGRQSA